MRDSFKEKFFYRGKVDFFGSQFFSRGVNVIFMNLIFGLEVSFGQFYGFLIVRGGCMYYLGVIVFL